MLNIEDYRLILDTLKKVKEKPRPFFGICTNFLDRLYDMHEGRWEMPTLLQLRDPVLTAAEQWPEYSGHHHYPVHTNRKVHPAYQFNKTWFYWTRLTSYGRARRRLLDFLINHFEELVEQHDTP